MGTDRSLSSRDSDPAAVTAAIGAGSADEHAPRRRTPVAEPGARMGRYLVIEELGRGAMGIVVRAYDPRLQREVALKALRPRLFSSEDRARIVREARALAKLAHPNVVAVYDVESDDRGGVIVAMQYVAGATLDKWLKKPRPAPAVVGVLIDVAHALEAAHAAGLLHRDVKPTNVVVGDDGRARMLDFGLARSGSTVMSSSGDALPRGEIEVGADTPLTVEGTVMGTPAFMALEQHMGDVLTPAADQFGFCAMAWLALTSERPFDGADYRALVEAKQAGPAPWPRTQGVSTRLGEAIRRGLAADPSSRWPAMAVLARELEREIAPRRSASKLWIGGGIAACAIAAVAWVARGDDERCSGSATALAGVWDEDARARAESALLGTGVSFAAPTWESLRPTIDAWAQSWTDAHHEACAATTIRGEQSAALMDLRMACLHRASLELAAIANVLASADVETVAHADDLARRLPALARCSDIEALHGETGPPSELSSAVDAARAGIAEAAALRVAGKVRKSGERIAEVIAGLADVPYDLLAAEARLELALSSDDVGRYVVARDAVRESLQLALRQRDLLLAADAAILLVRLEGDRLDHYPAAHLYADIARGLLGTTPDPRREARLHQSLAWLALSEADLALGEREAREALALVEGVAGSESLEVLNARGHVSSALRLQSRNEEAEAMQRALLADRLRLQGPDHPDVASARHDLGSVLKMFPGRSAEAVEEFRAALAIRERVLGPDDPSTCNSRFDIAMETWTQDPKRSETEMRAALAGLERALGPEHARVGATHANLGNRLSSAGRLAEAQAEMQHAIDTFVALVGPDHVMVGTLRFNLGGVLVRRGRYADAAAQMRIALPIWEAHFAADDPRVLLAVEALANALQKSGDATAALGLAERAVELAEAQPEQLRAGPTWVLARVLWDLGERTRAHSLAESARAAYDERGAKQARDEIADWLRTH